MKQGEQLRLAVFSGNYNNLRDGANRALNRLVGYMLDMGADVKVFSPTIGKPAFAPVGELYSLPSIPFPGRGEYRLAYRFGAQTFGVLKDFDPHLVHLSAPDIINHKAKAFAKKLNRPVVASYHTAFEAYLKYYDISWLEPLTNMIYRSFYNGCDQVYVPSSAVAAHLKHHGVVTPILPWSRGINCDVFAPNKHSPAWRIAHGISRHVPIILFVGRLVKEKGLALMAETMAQLKTHDTAFQLVIAGAGPEHDWVREHLPDAKMLGHLEREQLSAAYANADIFFNPSETETFGNVTLEAMASGLACVCSKAGGTTDLVIDGQNGVLVAPGDAPAHAAALTTLLEEPALRESYGTKSRQMSLERSWNAVMDELLGHYETLLKHWYPKAQFAMGRLSAEQETRVRA
ncbi:MAG: glycosyltransferase family 1 protein [Pseudomonadota bacterium]